MSDRVHTKPSVKRIRRYSSDQLQPFALPQNRQPQLPACDQCDRPVVIGLSLCKWHITERFSQGDSPRLDPRRVPEPCPPCISGKGHGEGAGWAIKGQLRGG